MRSRSRSLSWRGQVFRFEYVRDSYRESGGPVWAVSRNREFIGMMPCSNEVTTKDFDVRGLRWLDELLSDGRKRKDGS